jgi:NADH-quinone oxidoreductase subunit J
MLELIVFYTFGTIAVISAILVITRQNAVHSAMFLAATLLSVAGVFLSLHAEFLAGVQVIVYVGGILVLFVFVIMLVPTDRAVFERRYNRQGKVALTVAAILVAELAYGVYSGRDIVFAEPVAGTVIEGNSQWVGTVLYQNYLLPFEIASILLLVAIIGAVVLSKKPQAEEQAGPIKGNSQGAGD